MSLAMYVWTNMQLEPTVILLMSKREKSADVLTSSTFSNVFRTGKLAGGGSRRMMLENVMDEAVVNKVVHNLQFTEIMLASQRSIGFRYITFSMSGINILVGAFNAS